MVTAIKSTHKIFKSAAYQKDIVSFQLMEIIRLTPMLLLSNRKDFVIGMSAPQMPIWVWTADEISEKSLNELCDAFYKRFKNGSSVYFVAKPAVANQLTEPFIKHFHADEHRVSMESFENCTVLSPKNQEVLIERPTSADIADIAECMAGFEKDCLDREADSNSFLDDAEAGIQNPYFFVIKQDGAVVAMAKSMRDAGGYIAVNSVYTKPEYRGRGFAGALVAHISTLILQNGKTPVLYTDLKNPASNKAYKNVGFTEKGRVDEVKLTWNT